MSLHLFSRRGSWSQTILVSMGLLDELITGIPFVALPLLRDRLELSYAQIGLLFTAAALSGMLIEPFINLLSDPGPKSSGFSVGWSCWLSRMS